MFPYGPGLVANSIKGRSCNSQLKVSLGRARKGTDFPSIWPRGSLLLQTGGKPAFLRAKSPAILPDSHVGEETAPAPGSCPHMPSPPGGAPGILPQRNTTPPRINLCAHAQTCQILCNPTLELAIKWKIGFPDQETSSH